MATEFERRRHQTRVAFDDIVNQAMSDMSDAEYRQWCDAELLDPEDPANNAVYEEWWRTWDDGGETGLVG